MALHMVTGYVAPDSGMTEADVQTAIDDWVSARTKWSEGNANATVVRGNTSIDGSGVDYLQFSVRFTWDSAAKDNTLQKAADKFKNKVAWFSLVWHECYHDEGGACSWDERRDWDDGTGIPPEVLDELPDAQTVMGA